VLTATRAPQHVRLSRANDAYEHLCILTLLPSLAPLRLMLADTPWLTVSVLLLRMWVHCPRASNGPLPRRSNLVGYVRWDTRSDQFLLVRQSFQQLSGRNPVSPLSGSVYNRFSQAYLRLLIGEIGGNSTKRPFRLPLDIATRLEKWI